jgi:hypothetical protein
MLTHDEATLNLAVTTKDKIGEAALYESARAKEDAGRNL